jgi:hypothetical protein
MDSNLLAYVKKPIKSRIHYIMKFQKDNLIKYAIMFVVVYFASKLIPTCGVLQEHAIYVALIASSTFALLDVCYPQVVVKKEDETLG